MFAGLIAPNVFNNIYEYPILIAAALLALPGMFGEKIHFIRGAAPPLLAAAVVVGLRMVLDLRLLADAELSIDAVLVIVATLMLLQAQRPARFFGYVVLAFVISGLWQAGLTKILTARSFFGVHESSRPSTAPIVCCTTAPPCTAPSTCATSRAGR